MIQTNATCAFASICVFVLVCTRAGFEFYICSAVLRHQANTGSGAVFNCLWLAALLWRSRIKCHRLRLSTQVWALSFSSCALFHSLPFAVCSGSRCCTKGSTRITIEFFSSCNLGKALCFNASIWKEIDQRSLMPHLGVFQSDKIIKPVAVLSLRSLRSALHCEIDVHALDTPTRRDAARQVVCYTG